MNLYKIRGGNKIDLDSKKYTINVGISLGNKWFTAQNTTDLIQWALEHTKDVVILNVVDLIHSINLEVSEKLSKADALDKAIKLGKEFLSEIQNLVQTKFSAQDKKRIIFTTWNDVVTPEYKRKVDALYTFYDSNEVFKNTIHDMVRKYISRKNIIYSESDIHKLGNYIIEELPEITCCVPIAGVVCDAYVYPFDGEVTRMVEQIQKGEIFSEILNILMDIKPKVFLEVR